MKRVDRYILRESLPPFLAGTVLFIAMVLARLIVGSTETIFSYDTPWRDTLRWLALRIPVIITFAVPVGAMVAVAMAVLRLGRDSEITAFRMGGVPARRIFAPTFVAGALLAVVSLLNSEFVAPPAARLANAHLFRVILQRGDDPVKDNATFTVGGQSYCHVSRVDREQKVLLNVMIYRFQAGRPSEALTAPECRYTPDGWRLLKGRRYRFDEHGAPTAIEPFDLLPVAFADDLEALWDEDKDPDEMTIAQVWRRLRLHEAASDQLNAVRMRFYLHRKFAVPATVPVFVLLACAICLPGARPGNQPIVGLLLAIVILFFCNGTMNYAKTIALSGPRAWLPPALAAWLHVLVFGGIGLAFLRKAEL